MSLMGIDIGTTGCKVSVFSESGECIAHSYSEYDVLTENPGWKELDSIELWGKIKLCIKEAAVRCCHDPIKALSVSSFGEAMTPVSKDRTILGNCILAPDIRGSEYIEWIEGKVGKDRLYEINKNNLDYSYSLPKLLWIKDYKPDLFENAYKFLLWQDLVYFLLGCEPVTDYSLASRTLLFDLKRKKWSEEILSATGIPEEKLPYLAPSGTNIGYVADTIARKLGLPPNVAVVVGGHDQCCNSLGTGIVKKGCAACGMGTYICVTPVFEDAGNISRLEGNRFGIESFVLPELFVTLLYNATGGSILKWFRDSFCQVEKDILSKRGVDIYGVLDSEIPESPSGIIVLPYFLSTESENAGKCASGVISGLSLDTSRGEFVKGLMEGVVYFIKEKIELLEKAGMAINEYRPTGGGSKSGVWVQIAADIIGKPFLKPGITEAGSLGAAILAGTGIGAFTSPAEAAYKLVEIEKVYEPDLKRHRLYMEEMESYKSLLQNVSR